MMTISDVLAGRHGVHTSRAAVCFPSTQAISSRPTGQCGRGARERSLSHSRGTASNSRGSTSAAHPNPNGIATPVSALTRSKSMATRGMRNCKGHDGYVPRTFVTPYAQQEIPARHPGQVENKEDQLRSPRFSLRKPAGAEKVI
jgi:hypothetical protein